MMLYWPSAQWWPVSAVVVTWPALACTLQPPSVSPLLTTTHQPAATLDNWMENFLD